MSEEEKSITIKKSDLWKYSTFVLVAVVVIGGIFMFTGNGGSPTGAAVGAGNPVPTAPTQQLELQQILKVEARLKKSLAEKENSLIHDALHKGAVDTLLVASDYYAKTPEENNRIINMIELAEKTSAEVEFITNKKVLEKLHNYGSVMAILRYKM